MTIKAVFFDVGETLLDETSDWGGWADYLGISRLTFFAALGAVIERGQHHHAVFGLVCPGSDYATLRRQRDAAASPEAPVQTDLYPDALPCLALLRERGIRVGIAGNQPLAIEAALRAMQVPADFVASSARWGVEKPSPAFFERVVATTQGLAPNEIAYVGDRLDNDVEPALRAGMVGIFLRRGPWALIQATRVDACARRYEISNLMELLPLLAEL